MKNSVDLDQLEPDDLDQHCFQKAFRILKKLCIYRGFYISVHVLLNLLNELGKRDKMRG